MAALLGNRIGRKLLDALGLPKMTTWLELRIAAGEVVSVKCGYYPDDLTEDKLVESVTEYELHAKTTPCTECGAEGFRTTEGLCDGCYATKTQNA